MKGKRDRMDVIYDILNEIQKEQYKGGIKTTHLLYKSNLSYKLLQNYMDELKEADMIEEKKKKKGRKRKKQKGKKTIFLTEKGQNFLVELRKMRKFIESFGL